MLRYARANDAAAVRALWEQGFGQDEPYTDWYFRQVYRPERTLLWVEGAQVRACLQLAPYQLRCQGQTLRAAYIVGVVTDAAYRGQGLASSLLEQALKDLHASGYTLALLSTDIPEFYARLGFCTCYSLRHLSFPCSLPDSGANLDQWREIKPLPELLARCDEIYRQMCASFDGYVLRTPQNWINFVSDWLDGGRNQLWLGPHAYLLTDRDENGLRIRELGYKDKVALRGALALAGRLAEGQGRAGFTWDAPPSAPLLRQGAEREIPWVMACLTDRQPGQTVEMLAEATRKLLGAPSPRLWISEIT